MEKLNKPILYLPNKEHRGNKPQGCGIFVLINPNERLDSHNKTLNKMVESLAHRGPEGKEIDVFETWAGTQVVLGHRRLAIQDRVGVDNAELNVRPRAAMPMTRTYGGKTYTISFNGEVYNHLRFRTDLEEKGATFSTTGDTEAIIAAHHYYGPEGAIERFNGMYAYAMYDHQTGDTTLVRDRVGVKPLYYAHLSGNSFIAASEPKAILAHPLFSPKLNTDVLLINQMFSMWGDMSESHFKGIKQMDPGSIMTISPKGEIKDYHRYWQPEIAENERPINSIVEELAYLFEDSVRLRLLSDVPLASACSGGLDSSSVAAMAHRIARTVSAFVIEYDPSQDLDSQAGNEDLRYASIIPDYRGEGFDLIRALIPKESLTEEELIKTVHAMDGIPDALRLSSLRSLYETISKMGFVVTLIGEGPDDWLGGYHFVPYRPYWRMNEKQLHDTENLAIMHVERNNIGWAMHDEIWNTEIGKELARRHLEKNYMPYLDKTRDSRNAVRMWDHNTMLQSALQAHDRLSMAAGVMRNNSVETRVPWLDYRIVELAASIPYATLIGDGREKYPVRQMASELSLLPPALIRREKSPLPHTPKEYNEQIAQLLKQRAIDFQKSPFMRSLFRDDALKYIADNVDDTTIQSQLPTFYLTYLFGKQYMGG